MKRVGRLLPWCVLLAGCSAGDPDVLRGEAQVVEIATLGNRMSVMLDFFERRYPLSDKQSADLAGVQRGDHVTVLYRKPPHRGGVLSEPQQRVEILDVSKHARSSK